ncbi:phage tail tube protein [Roseomonas mucosa]|uniref:phage tail tube protein n=1 Tax=Roseomonas mucosa TaxID=207340 RepID=UPI0038508990
MPVGAQGSSFKLLVKQETTENVQATGNFVQLPCYTFDLAGSQDLQTDQILSAGFGRDAADPFLDVLNVQGGGRVPVDLVSTGYWLKFLLGSPVDTGTTDVTHVFKSGSTALPTFTAEKAFPDAGLFEDFTGVRANTLTMDLAPSGAADMTIGLMGVSAAVAGATIGGTPTIPALTRFLKAQGGITLDGAALGRVTGGNLNFSNNMTPVRTIRSDNRLEGIDFGQATAGGQLTLRLADTTLINKAVSNTPVALAYSYVISATKSLLFEFPRTFLSRPGIPVNGPSGVELPASWQAAYDPTAGCLMRVTLKNQIATY